MYINPDLSIKICIKLIIVIGQNILTMFKNKIYKIKITHIDL